MLAVLRDENAKPERRDDMAKAAAPYIHPRLSNVEAKIGGDPEKPIALSAEERVKLARAAIAEAFAEVVREREEEPAPEPPLLTLQAATVTLPSVVAPSPSVAQARGRRASPDDSGWAD